MMSSRARKRFHRRRTQVDRALKPAAVSHGSGARSREGNGRNMYFISLRDGRATELPPAAVEYVIDNPDLALFYGSEPVVCALGWQACQQALEALPRLGCMPRQFMVSRRQPAALRMVS